MNTRPDAAETPAPESGPGPAANMPDRCNTRIIDPALLEGIVPQSPPESRRAVSVDASDSASAKRTPGASGPPSEPAEGAPLSVAPAAKTMVVEYAPKVPRDRERTAALVLFALSLIALGTATVQWAYRPAPHGSSVANQGPTEGASARSGAVAAVDSRPPRAAFVVPPDDATAPLSEPTTNATSGSPPAKVRVAAPPGSVRSSTGNPPATTAPAAGTPTVKMVFPND